MIIFDGEWSNRGQSSPQEYPVLKEWTQVAFLRNFSWTTMGRHTTESHPELEHHLWWEDIEPHTWGASLIANLFRVSLFVELGWG